MLLGCRWRSAGKRFFGRSLKKLSEDEANLIQTHVDASIQLLESKEPLSFNVRLGINEHHERMDGNGYPRGLAGGEIVFFGRLAAGLDSFRHDLATSSQLKPVSF